MLHQSPDKQIPCPHILKYPALTGHRTLPAHQNPDIAANIPASFADFLQLRQPAAAVQTARTPPASYILEMPVLQ